MRVPIEDRRVLVTGASSGIGRALALELAGGGARLAVVARRRALLEDLAEEIADRGGRRPVVVTADLSRRGTARSVAAEASSELGGVDVLVNNAGANVGATQWVAGDRDEVREAFETDFWTPLALVQALVPAMRDGGRGAVVNVTSLSQVVSWPALGNLSTTKAALALATQTLELELQHSGVHVLEVVPGPIATAVQAESALVPGFASALRRMPMGDPEVLARRIVRALRRGRRRLVYPRALAIAYAVPGVARWNARRLVARLDPGFADDARLVRSGSFGDPPAREAREAWESARPRARVTG